MLRRSYSKEADIWSCGVILYILLCGYPPFHGENEKRIFESIMQNQLDFKSEPWPKISGAYGGWVEQFFRRTRKPAPSLPARATEASGQGYWMLRHVTTDWPWAIASEHLVWASGQNRPRVCHETRSPRSPASWRTRKYSLCARRACLTAFQRSWHA